jgi:hypothetical protein
VRRLVLVLAVGLGLLSSAAVAANPRDEQKRLRPADTALARRALLQIDDLDGVGWLRQPAPSNDGSTRCAGFDPDFSKFTITGEARSSFANQVAAAAIGSSVDVFATRAQAMNDFRLGAKPALARCLRELLAAEFRSSAPGVEATVASSTMLAAPRVGERAAKYRLVARIAGNGQALTVYMDVLGFQRGRSIAVMFFTGVMRPVRDQLAIARLVDSRLR